MNKVNISTSFYGIDNLFADFSNLLPFAHAALVREGVFKKCCNCGDNLVANNGANVARIESNVDGEEWAFFHPICPVCAATVDSDKLELSSEDCIPVPGNESARRELIKIVRELAIEEFVQQVGYPVAIKPLALDPMGTSGLIRTEGKSYPAFIPWKDTDPLLIGGQVVEDALVVSKSVLAGKTTIEEIFGNTVLVSTDDQLGRELAKGCN